MARAGHEFKLKGRDEDSCPDGEGQCGTDKVLRRRRPTAPIVLATATAVVVASLGVVARPAVAGRPVPGCRSRRGDLSALGAISFSPRVSASMAVGTRHGQGRLFGCNTSNPYVTITSGRVDETFTTTPLNCATLSSTGAAATLIVTWKGAVLGHAASFSPPRRPTPVRRS